MAHFINSKGQVYNNVLDTQQFFSEGFKVMHVHWNRTRASYHLALRERLNEVLA